MARALILFICALRPEQLPLLQLLTTLSLFKEVWCLACLWLNLYDQTDISVWIHIKPIQKHIIVLNRYQYIGYFYHFITYRFDQTHTNTYYWYWLNPRIVKLCFFLVSFGEVLTCLSGFSSMGDPLPPIPEIFSPLDHKMLAFFAGICLVFFHNSNLEAKFNYRVSQKNGVSPFY